MPVGESQQQGPEAVGRIAYKDGSDGCMPVPLSISPYTQSRAFCLWNDSFHID